MSVCEKCWADAGVHSNFEYRDLLQMRERAGQTCTPEEQAGPDARICSVCKRRVAHQYTGECMAGCHAAHGHKRANPESVGSATIAALATALDPSTLQSNTPSEPAPSQPSSPPGDSK